MKLRIRGNSLRLRLLRTEVEHFGKTGRFVESIQFGPSRLEYAIEAQADAREITSEFSGTRITVRVPSKTAREWAESDLISLRAEQPVDDEMPESTLKILIEKDFVCIDRKDDPDAPNAFPHPLTADVLSTER